MEARWHLLPPKFFDVACAPSDGFDISITSFDSLTARTFTGATEANMKQTGVRTRDAGLAVCKALFERVHQLGKQLAPLLEVLEHVITGAGRREKHRITRPGSGRSLPHHFFVVGAAQDLR